MAMSEVRVLEYLDTTGRSPFRRWFDDLDGIAAPKVSAALYRLAQGNFLILLGGGTKKRQSRDISAAAEAWTDYKKRKPR